MKALRSLARAAALSTCVSTCVSACGGEVTTPAPAFSVTNPSARFTPPTVSVAAFAGPASATSTCGEFVDGGNTCVSMPSGQKIVLLTTNRTDLSCSRVLSAGAVELNAAYLQAFEIDVFNAVGDVTAGTYSVGAQAAAKYVTLDATCSQDLLLGAGAGSVSISAIDSRHVVGSFALDVGDQNPMQGTFDLPLCNGDDAGGIVGPGSNACRK